MPLLENIGHMEIKMSKAFTDTIIDSVEVFLRMFRRRTYSSAMRMVLLNQIYFTSVQILPLFLIVSVILGSLLVGIVFQMLKQLGLTDFFGNVLMGLIVTELAPFFTVLLITLRSGSAINTEIAVMKVNKEIKTLETFRIDIIDYLIIPRIINGIVSLVLLSSLFSILLLASGILFSELIFGMGVEVYSNIILNSANLSGIIISLV